MDMLDLMILYLKIAERKLLLSLTILIIVSNAKEKLLLHLMVLKCLVAVEIWFI